MWRFYNLSYFLLMLLLIGCSKHTNNSNQPIEKFVLIDFATSKTVTKDTTRNYNSSNNKMEASSGGSKIDTNQLYFPKELITEKYNDLQLNIRSASWYSEKLRALKEPILFNQKPNVEIYRLTLLRAKADDKPIAIRISKDGDIYKIYWKLCDGARDNNPGNFIINQSQTLDFNKWNRFSGLLSKTKFWKMKTSKYVLGLDGEQWILEGVDPNKYHVVSRWSPDHGKFYDCCNYLISLTDLKKSGNY